MATTREKSTSHYDDLSTDDLKLIQFRPNPNSVEQHDGVRPTGQHLLTRQSDRIYRLIRSERKRGLQEARPELAHRFRNFHRAYDTVLELARMANVSMFEIHDDKVKRAVGLAGIIHNQVIEVDQTDDFQTRKIVGFDMDYLLHSHVAPRADVHAWAADALLKESVALAQKAEVPSYEIFHTNLGTDVSIEGQLPMQAIGFDTHPGMQQVGGLAVRQRTFANLPFEPIWQNLPTTLHIAH